MTIPAARAVRNEPIPSGLRHTTTYALGAALGVGLMAIGVPELAAMAAGATLAGALGAVWRLLHG